MDATRTNQARSGIRSELARNREGRQADFPALPNMPYGRYTDPAFYQLENERFWTRTWLLAGHMGEFPERGCYKVWNHLGVPIVLVRGMDDRIRAFHNVCRHRGGTFVDQPAGRLKVFSCRFHGWTFGLDGRFKGMPVPQDFPGFDAEANGLLEVRCEPWGQLLFINRDDDAPSLMESFGPRMTEEMRDYDFDKRVVFHTAGYDVMTNWKWVWDAFLEEYHAYTVHAGSFGPALQPGGVFMSLFDNGHSRMVTPMRDDNPELKSTNPMYNTSRDDPRHAVNREAFVSYSIFPNITGAFSENEFALFAMWPKGPLETYVDLYFTTIPENGAINKERCDMFLQQFPIIMEEDIVNCRNSAPGLNGGALAGHGFNMGYGDRRIHHWHEAMDRTIGIDNIPQKLRVRQMLQPFHER